MARLGRPAGSSYASRAVVLKVFLGKNPELSFTDICSATRLAPGTVSKRLEELVATGKLTKRRTGKKQLYKPVLQDCREPLVIVGPHKERQVQRLIRMGLEPFSDFVWVKRARGRPKRFPNFNEDAKLHEDISRLLFSSSSPAIRYVEKQAGLRYKEKDWGWEITPSFGYTESQIAAIRKAIPKAKEHYKALKRQNRRWVPTAC